MKVLHKKVLRGPNVWSSYRQQLIEMKLDLGESEEFPTNKIDGFADRLEAMLPSMYEHECSEKKPGGFFERVRHGTWLGHVIEHVALEIQTLAGMEVGYGRTRSTKQKGVYHVVFAYEVESAGLYAADAAVRIVQAIESDRHYDLSADIKKLKDINRNEGLGPSTASLVNEAKKRKIPVKRLDTDSLVMFGQGKYQKVICSTMACTTSGIGMEIASDKHETKRILRENYVPLPEGTSIRYSDQLEEAIADIGFPVVIKPADGNHGRAVKLNITTMEEAVEAFNAAKEVSRRVIIERYIKGADYRLIVIDYKLHAVARRTPAAVIGDNKRTLQQLIDDTNSDPRRGDGHEKTLTKIKVDSVTQSILIEKNLTLNSVLPFGEIVFLKDAANLSSGGTATDVTDYVHPANIFMAERIARLIGLDICGIDIVAEDITKPITGKNGAVLEVNAGPGFRMHLSPTNGTPRNIAEPVLNMLFPPGTPSRIPVVAVTGTNGKTTTTRLIAHLAKNAGHTVGYTTTDGIYIQDQLIHHGDCSGPGSAEVVLRDPIVDFAVLECARGGILRSGLGFDKCNISIITNITEDHLGLNEIDTLQELARVKSVVAASTADDGHAILNADDDVVYKIKNKLDCNIALFSTHADNERVLSHCKKGGMAAIVEKGYFTLLKGEWKIRVAKVTDVPLTINGTACCMIKNILPSLLAAVLSGFEIGVIRKAIQSFVPGPELTPGRMNIFCFPEFKVMVDYAHNIDGFEQLKEFFRNVHSHPKVGIIGFPGDRRDTDIIRMATCCAEMFDEIIIRHDHDGRGRTNGEITALIMQGIHQVKPEMNPLVISDEVCAVDHAVANAVPGSFITVCTDDVQGSIEHVTALQNQSSVSNFVL